MGEALLQELPEQVYLHPPLSIFVVEQRAFGRTVLVGTHVVSHIMKFSPRELEELEEEPENLPKGEFPGLNGAVAAPSQGRVVQSFSLPSAAGGSGNNVPACCRSAAFSACLCSLSLAWGSAAEM